VPVPDASRDVVTCIYLFHELPPRVRRVVAGLEQAYPSAQVSARSVALVSAIGRDLKGLHAFRRGLAALEEAEIDVIAAHQTTGDVYIQFVTPRGASRRAVDALHRVLVTGQDARVVDVAA